MPDHLRVKAREILIERFLHVAGQEFSGLWPLKYRAPRWVARKVTSRLVGDELLNVLGALQNV